MANNQRTFRAYGGGRPAHRGTGGRRASYASSRGHFGSGPSPNNSGQHFNGQWPAVYPQYSQYQPPHPPYTYLPSQPSHAWPGYPPPPFSSASSSSPFHTTGEISPHDQAIPLPRQLASHLASSGDVGPEAFGSADMRAGIRVHEQLETPTEETGSASKRRRIEDLELPEKLLVPSSDDDDMPYDIGPTLHMLVDQIVELKKQNQELHAQVQYLAETNQTTAPATSTSTSTLQAGKGLTKSEADLAISAEIRALMKRMIGLPPGKVEDYPESGSERYADPDMDGAVVTEAEQYWSPYWEKSVADQANAAFLNQVVVDYLAELNENGTSYPPELLTEDAIRRRAMTYLRTLSAAATKTDLKIKKDGTRKRRYGRKKAIAAERRAIARTLEMQMNIGGLVELCKSDYMSSQHSSCGDADPEEWHERAGSSGNKKLERRQRACRSVKLVNFYYVLDEKRRHLNKDVRPRVGRFHGFEKNISHKAPDGKDQVYEVAISEEYREEHPELVVLPTPLGLAETLDIINRQPVGEDDARILDWIRDQQQQNTATNGTGSGSPTIDDLVRQTAIISTNVESQEQAILPATLASLVGPCPPTNLIGISQPQETMTTSTVPAATTPTASDNVEQLALETGSSNIDNITQMPTAVDATSLESGVAFEPEPVETSTEARRGRGRGRGAMGGTRAAQTLQTSDSEQTGPSPEEGTTGDVPTISKKSRKRRNAGQSEGTQPIEGGTGRPKRTAAQKR